MISGHGFFHVTLEHGNNLVFDNFVLKTRNIGQIRGREFQPGSVDGKILNVACLRIGYDFARKNEILWTEL